MKSKDYNLMNYSNTSIKWKLRFNNHNCSFSHEHLKNQTALSKHFWKLKNKGLTPEIQWSI